MNRLLLIAVCSLGACVGIFAADWPTVSGSPQRDGWAKSETDFTRENVKGLELLYKVKAENQARGADALTTPIINTRIITYLGFKEELVFGGSSDNVFAIDADLNRLIWKTHFDYKGEKPQAAPTAVCPGGMTASVAMNGSSTVVAGRGGGAPGRAGAGRGGRGGMQGRGAQPAIVIPPGRAGGVARAGNNNRSGEYFAIGGDGYLHILNTSTGEDRVAPKKFLPANAKVSALNVRDSTVYAVTLDGCAGNPNMVYAIDVSGEMPAPPVFGAPGAQTENIAAPAPEPWKVRSVALDGNAAGTGGTSIGDDGTVYVQVNDTVHAFAAKTLEAKGSFTAPAGKAAGGSVTPAVISWQDKDAVVAGTQDGRLFLLDSAALGNPLASTESAAPSGFRGAFSSWIDAATSTRWIYAATSDSIMAFRLEEQNGKPVFTKAWTSKQMTGPAPPVTANGLVFALATGDGSKRAVLSVLDGSTGAELYSSGTMAATWVHGSGLAVANKRIYFTTHDNLVYCLGFFVDQPQLTGR